MIVQPIINYTQDFFTGDDHAGLRPDRRRSPGLRLVDGRASYGLGLETFALGFPIHFDWSWRTLLQQGLGRLRVFLQRGVDGESSGSHWLRRPKFSIWIGYDF